MERLKRNAAICNHCGSVVESKYRHDYQACTCLEEFESEHGIFVDGGKDYSRYGYVHKDDFINLCEWRTL